MDTRNLSGGLAEGHVIEVIVWSGDSYRPATGTSTVAEVTEALKAAGIIASVRWDRATPALLTT